MNVKQMRLIMCVAILMLIPFNFSPLLSQTSPQFVLVEGGTFIMGSTENEKGRSKDEIRHKVRVNSFYLSRTEVTQGQYSSVMKTPPPSSENTLMPMQFVSWYEAVEFCNELSRKSGLIPFYNIVQNEVSFNFQANGYRLPSEAEWEYAARGGKIGKGYLYSGGNNADEVAWHSGNSQSGNHPVATKKANELGLFDMSGSVNEWCNDWYGDYNIKNKMVLIEPKAPEKSKCRVVRGGGWRIDLSSCRVAYRGSLTPDHRDYSYGFRLARNAPQKK